MRLVLTRTPSSSVFAAFQSRSSFPSQCGPTVCFPVSSASCCFASALRRAAGATAAARPRPRPIPQPPATLLLPLSSWKACARRAAAPPSRCVRACGRLGPAGPRARPGTRCRSRGEERGGGGNTVTLWPGKRARRDPFFFLLYFSPSRSFPAAARHQKSAGPTHKNEHTKIKSPPAV